MTQSQLRRVTLSELWLGSTHEFVRLLRDRKLIDDGDGAAIAHDLRLLRVAIEKHEIAGDRDMKARLQLRRMPSLNDRSDLYVYDKTDRKRAHIMPRGLSPTSGSIVWQVIDINDDRERQIERRELSDRVLKMWGEKTPAAVA